MNQSSASVVLKDLTRMFGSFTAVDRLNLEVGSGEVFGFLGPNGAGKSTTIRMLCGLLKPTSGFGTVAGFDILRDPEKLKPSIGYMSQKFSLYPDLTAMENLDFYAGIYTAGRRLDPGRKGAVLEEVGLRGIEKRPTGSLPSGWRQRLALACAIVHEPGILFLDEPTSGVDPSGRRSFWELIYGLASRGVTVFVTTHYMDEAEYCGRLGLIHMGRLIALGTPAELRGRTSGRDSGKPRSLEDVFIELVGAQGARMDG